ncbi:hypothetical protein CWB72_10525 [Pseudoalteromonas phenolica]|uniref:hypothetical protein n=1 Tax=Pseudoalteromonas phenolica TaxID=161398 RepID=UPI00110A7BF6|nr:hypothetical protein [Pseudoalteromonas phenolica]TMN89463.1 hypothetical protein CWB72_10525 [Pseudoalteromonas phenolica]
MSNQNLTITEKLTHVSERANALCDTVQAQLGNINSTLDSKLLEFKTQMENALGDFNHDTNHAIQEVEQLKSEVIADNNQKLAEFKAKYHNETHLDLLTMPLNKNAFLIAGENGNPLDGYGSVGSVNIYAVHPFTKGFEGPYLDSPPANTAESLESATDSTPFYFGRYYKGPRASRGGLYDGWNGLGTVNHGHLLKVHKPAGEQHHYNNRLLIPIQHFKRTKARLRGYVYVSKGPLSFRAGVTDSNIQIDVPNRGEWYFIDEIITNSEITKGYFSIVIQHEEECELYFAMLNIHSVQGNHSNETLIQRDF